MMWMKEGYKPLDGEERMRMERLLSEMGMERKLNIYCNRDARTNAVTFGFHTIGLTGGILQTASDEELKGVISHEVGHISHYDFVYQVRLFSMQLLGYRCLYGLFLIPALFFGLAGNLIIAVVPAVRFAVVGIARRWGSLYKLLHHTIYGISRIADVNINKYAEYRCDTYAVRYGCGEGQQNLQSRLGVAGTGEGRTSLNEYIMETPTSNEKRIVRLEKLL